MAWLSKVITRESRNGDGSLFSRGLEMEVLFGAEEVPIDLTAPEPDLRLLEILSKAGASVTLALDGPVPEFETADKLLPKSAEVKPAAAAPPAKVEPKPAAAPETKPAAAAEEVLCSICLTPVIDKESKKTPGKIYKFCPKCNANRQRNGRPFEPVPVKGV